MAVSGGAGGGDLDGGYKPLAEINVTPLVDVMLVLLIIFMVAAPLMMVGVPVELPQTSAPKVSQPKTPVIVSVTRSGEVYVREDPVAPDAVVEHLARLKAEIGDAVVYVRGDRGIEYGKVMNVLGQVGQAGFDKVSLIAEAQTAAAAP
jgi:biopolymer transport protein TolR